MLIWDLIPPWSVGFFSVFSYVSWRQVSLGSYRLLAPNFYMLKSPPFSWTVSKFYPSLPTAFMNTKITQTPRYLVMGRANDKSLDCKQHLGHNAMYWYQQKAGKPPELMFLYNLKNLIRNETVPLRFLPECPDTSQLFLHLSGLEPEDSAVYWCASSQDTALQIHELSVHKPTSSGNCGTTEGFAEHFLWDPRQALQTITVPSNSTHVAPLSSMVILEVVLPSLCRALLPTGDRLNICGS